MSPRWVSCACSALWMASLITLIAVVNGSLHGQQDAPPNNPESRERIVMLKSGRIMTGRVMRNAGGYLIEQDGGRVQLTLEDVRFVVDSFREGYRKQRDSIVEPTPATHIALANWCISYKLYDEASDELKKCLKSDPENEAARRLLQRLTDTIRANLPPAPEKPVVRKTSDGFTPPEVESLGGLSRETALQFTTRIQPLMLHKCGNASCHGMASSNEFRVMSSRVSGHGARQTAERNLAETLRQIDFDNAAKSKILEALQGAHGGKAAIFSGSNSQDQMKTFRRWVRTVAEEKKADADAAEQRRLLASKKKSKKRNKSLVEKQEKKSESPIRQVSSSDEDKDEDGEETDASMPKELKPDPTDAAALARKPVDAFDPEQFNQQFRP